MAHQRIYQTGYETNTYLEASIMTSALDFLSIGVADIGENANTGTCTISTQVFRIWLNDDVGHNQISMNYYLFLGRINSLVRIGRFYGRRYDDGSTFFIEVMYDEATSEFYAVDNSGVELGTRVSVYMSPYRVGQWMPIGFNVKAGAGGWISMYVDGMLAFKVEGNLFEENSIFEFLMGNLTHILGGTAFYVDDLSINACTEDEPDASPHSPRFFPIRPNSRGHSTDWTPIGVEDNYLAVNQRRDTHNTAPYLMTTQDGAKDTYGIPAPIIDKIAAMIPVALVQGGVSDKTIKLQMVCHRNGTEVLGVEQEIGYALDIYTERFDKTPDGLDWTTGLAGDCEYGFVVTFEERE